MVENLPPAPGGGPPVGPPSSTRWAPAYAIQPLPRSRAWPAIALAAVAVLLSAGSLVVALTRPPSGPARGPATASSAPTYTAEETAAAHQKLCDVYKLAARAVQIETNGTSPELAGVATVNGAVMLEEAINSAPAIAPSDRAAARALAEAYSNAAAVSSLAGGDDPEWRAAVSDANVKDAAMKKVCGVT